MSNRLWAGPIRASDNFEESTAGIFLPQGSSAPTIASPPGHTQWAVSRIATGRFLVTLLHGSPGFVKAEHVHLQVDSAGSDLNLQAVWGPVTIVDGNVSLEIDVYDTTTGALTDITQPMSPSNNGSAVHWSVQASAIRSIVNGGA